MPDKKIEQEITFQIRHFLLHKGLTKSPRSAGRMDAAAREAMHDGVRDPDIILGWAIVYALLSEWLDQRHMELKFALRPDKRQETTQHVERFVEEATQYILKLRREDGVSWLCQCLFYFIGHDPRAPKTARGLRAILGEYAAMHFATLEHPT